LDRPLLSVAVDPRRSPTAPAVPNDPTKSRLTRAAATTLFVAPDIVLKPAIGWLCARQAVNVPLAANPTASRTRRPQPALDSPGFLVRVAPIGILLVFDRPALPSRLSVDLPPVRLTGRHDAPVASRPSSRQITRSLRPMIEARVSADRDLHRLALPPMSLQVCFPSGASMP
jgi:hypothetical protein